MYRLSPLPVLAALAVVAVAVLAVALAVGSVEVKLATVWRALFDDDASTAASVVRDLRLPRAVAAFAVGGLLAVSYTHLTLPTNREV